MNRRGRIARGDLVPLTDRIRHMRAFRLVAAAIVVSAWFAVPTIQDAVPAKPLAVITGGYLAVSLLGELVWRLGRRRGLSLLSALLIVDGLYLAWVIHATGGQASAMRALVLVHVIAVALLASFPTGLKLAMWHSLLALATFHLLEAGFLDSPAGPVRFGDSTFRLLVLDIAVLWSVALATATFAAVNERELRRRRYDLEALARLSLQLESSSEPSAVADAVLDAVGDDFGYERMVLLSMEEEGARVLAHRGASGTDVDVLELPPGSLLDQAATSRETVLVSRLSAAHDGALAELLPQSRNLVALPLHAESRVMGFLLVEHGARRRSRIERRAVAILERFASQSALALANAWHVERLERLATRDGLTGLFNRRALEESLAAELSRSRRTGEPLSIVMLDIDHFKRLNDTHGHQVGDAALRAVAAALVDAARSCDVVGRYGGEEFIVVLPGLPPDDAVAVAERLRSAIGALCDPVPMTASLGVAGHPAHALDAERLIKVADDALYSAKEGGRNRTVLGASYGREERLAA